MRSLWRVFLVILLLFALFRQNAPVRAQTMLYREVLALGVDELYVFNAVFSSDGSKIATWNNTPTNFELVIWDSTTGKGLKRFNQDSDLDSVKGLPRALRWSPDNQYLLGVVEDYNYPERAVYVWSIGTGQRTTIADRTSIDGKLTKDGLRVSILEAYWRPKTLSLLLLDVDGIARLIDFPSGNLHWSIPLYNEPYFCLEVFCNPTWSPDGMQFVSRNGSAAIFDGVTGKQILQLVKPNHGRDSHTQWTADGKYIFDNPVGDGGENNALYVWNATTGNLVDIAIKKVDRVAFSLHPDGEKIVFASNYEGTELTVAKWQTGTLLAQLALPFRVLVGGLSWSPDGKQLMIEEGNIVHIYAEVKLP